MKGVKMAEYIQVITTTDSKEAASKIARAVVEKRLAACAQVSGPIESTYWWEDKIETAEEWYCVIKSTGSAYNKLEEAIREAHSYDVPEILSTPILDGNPNYLEWLKKEVHE